MANDLEFFTLLINKYVDIVFANEEEAKAFTGKEPEEALRVIAKKCSIAIVKVGANGSYIRKGTEEIKVSAISVQKVVDTTGAGDYFASGFLYGLTCGYSLDKCAKIGAILRIGQNRTVQGANNVISEATYVFYNIVKSTVRKF